MLTGKKMSLDENGHSQKIYKELRNRICLQNYQKGAILKEEDIAKEFSVSRTPVREAMQLLKLDGLVESKKKVGTVVTGFDEENLDELYEIRIHLLDYVSIESETQYTEESIAKLEELLERTCNLQSSGLNTNEYWEINDELFAVLVSVISNKALKQMMCSLFFQTARRWAYLLPQNWIICCEILRDEIENELEFMKMFNRKGVVAVWKSYVMLSMQYCKFSSTH